MASNPFASRTLVCLSRQTHWWKYIIPLMVSQTLNIYAAPKHPKGTWNGTAPPRSAALRGLTESPGLDAHALVGRELRGQLEDAPRTK